MSRQDIYYWKCDRPAAFHGTGAHRTAGASLHPLLEQALRAHFQTSRLTLDPAISQGNHLTWQARIDGKPMFVRVENGPEGDSHLEMESRVLQEVQMTGVSTPQVYGFDASRQRTPFAWQAMELIAHPDLNHWQKLGQLDLRQIAPEIGIAIASWQGIRPKGFGPLDVEVLRREGVFQGYHTNYETYFRLHLERHAGFLVDQQFLTYEEAKDILAAVEEHRPLLQLQHGCLVHKDLALWNILGTQQAIAAFIDFDDAISGDPMDDLSLLGCFHDGEMLGCVMDGYTTLQVLPPNHRRRFWLHLLRNMLVKAVIRVGAGYFTRNDGFFLIRQGDNGSDLRSFTRARLFKALHCLRENADIRSL